MEEHTGRAKCHGTRCQTARWEIDTSVSAHCDYFIEKLSGGMHQREMVTALVPNIGALSWMFWGLTFVCGHTYCSTNVFSSKQRVGCLTTRKFIHSSFSSNTQGHRDAGVYPSSHWVRNRNTSHHECSCFCADCLFFFFFARWMFGANRLHTNYTQFTSLHLQCVCVCIVHRFCHSPDMNKALYREIFILAVHRDR